MKFILIFASICSCVVIICGFQQGNFKNRLGPRIHCGPDDVIIFQDCRICYCPRSNRNAHCVGKACTERTKPTGSCPNALLSMDDYDLCQPDPNQSLKFQPCQADTDCPGPQLCCFDFCKRSYCTNPVNNTAPQLGGPGRRF